MFIPLSNHRKTILMSLKTDHANGDLYIWGASYTAKYIADYIYNNISVPISAFIVDDKYFRDGEFDGKPVIKASEWKKQTGTGDIVVIGHTNETRARNQLSSMPPGIKAYYLIFPYFSLHFEQSIDEDYINAHNSQLEQVYDMLSDELSKTIMKEYISACASGNTDTLRQYSTNDQYFNELTVKAKSGIFVDMGAYDGDTIEAAVNFYKGRIRNFIAFEPEQKNFEALKARADRISEKIRISVQAICKGSWSSETILKFSEGCSSSSRVEEEGTVIVNTDTLDNILKGSNEDVSFIKLDVEGSELESLKGSRETIRRCLPVIAVCVYHRAEDIYSIPLWIRETAGKNAYKFFFRYHNDCLTEAVIYAIPDRK